MNTKHRPPENRGSGGAQGERVRIDPKNEEHRKIVYGMLSNIYKNRFDLSALADVETPSNIDREAFVVGTILKIAFGTQTPTVTMEELKDGLAYDLNPRKIVLGGGKSAEALRAVQRDYEGRSEG